MFIVKKGVITKVKNAKFFWKDKTGRGFTAKMVLGQIMESPDLENYFGESLHEWAQDAESGDEWENAAEKYTKL